MNDRNPYGSPTVNVEVAAPATRAPRPKPVVTALWLLCLTVPLDIPGIAHEYSQDPDPIALPLFLALVSLVIALFVCVGRGHNWARMVVTVLVGIVTIDSMGTSVFSTDPAWLRLMSAVSTGMAVAAAWLLHTRESSRWFRPARGD